MVYVFIADNIFLVYFVRNHYNASKNMDYFLFRELQSLVKKSYRMLTVQLGWVHLHDTYNTFILIALLIDSHSGSD